MRLYALAVGAFLQEGNKVRVRWNAGWCKARSEEEALGYALQQAKINWPKAEGWFGHDVSVIEIEADDGQT